MSGLDPLGRREIRELILRLRGRGCTVFFSSHVLADAEALCSRVAVMANGRLSATGTLADLVDFHVRGWELVVSGVADAALAQAKRLGHVVRETKVGEGRYSLELPLAPPPEQTLAALIAQGAQLVSLNPLRDTLEDFFMRQVNASAPRPSSVPGTRHPSAPAQERA
jgi:ABC-2 type transport system ATP-binding protein